MPPSPLQVADIWRHYRRGGMLERELLQGLSKQVAELKVPPTLMPGKFPMATQLAFAPCATKLQTADAIEALVAWADDNGIRVIDGAACSPRRSACHRCRRALPRPFLTLADQPQPSHAAHRRVADPKTTGGPGTTNRNNVFSHLALGPSLRGVAKGSEDVTRQVEAEENAMPVMSVQGTGRAGFAMNDAMKQKSRDNIERVMTARVPHW